MNVSGVVNVDVEVTGDHQRHWERWQSFQQLTEVVEEWLRHVARTWTVDDDDNGVETGAVNERGDNLERREDGQLDIACVQRRRVEQAHAAVICWHGPRTIAYT